MKRLEALAASIFGLAFLVLAVAVTIETVMRKVFNQSLQGVDELGGYILALAGALTFSAVVFPRIRLCRDRLRPHLPRPVVGSFAPHSYIFFPALPSALPWHSVFA